MASSAAANVGAAAAAAAGVAAAGGGGGVAAAASSGLSVGPAAKVNSLSAIPAVIFLFYFLFLFFFEKSQRVGGAGNLPQCCLLPSASVWFWMCRARLFLFFILTKIQSGSARGGWESASLLPAALCLSVVLAVSCSRDVCFVYVWEGFTPDICVTPKKK